MNHVAYADDMAVLAPSAKALQELLVICENFSAERDIVYNVKKTNCMIFRPKNFKVSVSAQFVLNGQRLSFSTQVTYLGHIINTDLKDDLDIFRQVKKLNVIGNVIIRRFQNCSEAVKCQLFRSYCSSLYCSSLWTIHNKASYRKLKVCHNDILRRLHGVPRWSSATTLFVSLNLDNIDVLIRKQSYSLRKRIAESENPCMVSLYNSMYFKTSKLCDLWRRNTEIVRQ